MWPSSHYLDSLVVDSWVYFWGKFYTRLYCVLWKLQSSSFVKLELFAWLNVVHFVCAETITETQLFVKWTMFSLQLLVIFCCFLQWSLLQVLCCHFTTSLGLSTVNTSCTALQHPCVSSEVSAFSSYVEAPSLMSSVHHIRNISSGNVPNFSVLSPHNFVLFNSGCPSFMVLWFFSASSVSWPCITAHPQNLFVDRTYLHSFWHECQIFHMGQKQECKSDN